MSLANILSVTLSWFWAPLYRWEFKEINMCSGFTQLSNDKTRSQYIFFSLWSQGTWMCSALHISQSIPKPSLQHYMLEESTLFLEYLSVLLKRDTSPLCHSSLPTREEDASWVQGCLPCLFQYFQWSSFPTLPPHISKSTASSQVILRWILYHSSWFHRMQTDILLSIILNRRLLSIL